MTKNARFMHPRLTTELWHFFGYLFLHRARVKAIRSLLCCLCTLGMFVAAPTARAQTDATAKLMEGAAKEGKFVWYSAMSLNDSKPMLDAFQKQYPFIKAELYRAGGKQIMNRVINEARAGHWQFDAVNASGVNILAQQKLIAPYISPEANAYIPEYKDPAGYWTAIYTSLLVPGYNTRLIAEADAPKSWEEFLDAKWKGKITIEDEDYTWFATLLSTWGKDRTHDYMRKLARQDIQWRRGHELMTNLMVSGELPLGIVYAHSMEAMKKKGAPVDWVNTVDPVVVVPITIGLSAQAKNPNAAKLFIDFILSKRGQEMVSSFNRISARADVKPLSPKLDQKKLKIRVVPDDLETRHKEYIQDFRSLLGIGEKQ